MMTLTPATMSTSQSTPVQVLGLTDPVRLFAGDEHNCALLQDESLWCWGSNYAGELGDGTMTNRHVPIEAAVLGGGVVSASPGDAYTCAIKNDGSLWCWGLNDNGALGNGTLEDSPVPVRVEVGRAVAEVWAGGHHSGGAHTCVRAQDGSAWCWGTNSDGRLGDGTPTDSPVPVQVNTAADFVRITTGAESSCGLQSDGQLVCWGNNRYFQLGNGDDVTQMSTVPTPVSIDLGCP